MNKLTKYNTPSFATWLGQKESKGKTNRASFNEPLPLSIYQNEIRTALSSSGEGSGENGGTWQKQGKKVFIKDTEVEVGGERRWGREKKMRET